MLRVTILLKTPQLEFLVKHQNTWRKYSYMVEHSNVDLIQTHLVLQFNTDSNKPKTGESLILGGLVESTMIEESILGVQLIEDGEKTRVMA